MKFAAKLVMCILLSSSIISCNQKNPFTDFERSIDLSNFQLKDGYSLDVIASEPLIEAPVDLIFDPFGKMWVVEMKGYMTDFTGSEEEIPNGQISYLEDKDGNGRMDHKTVFLDSLVLPRAIKYINGGILYATPPNLWWVPVEENNTPGKKILVDDAYAVGGNVEHQPNGLMYHLDNWLYNAKSNARYRFKDGKWKKEFIFLRGQWGITQDSFGHIFTNSNSSQFKGDYFLPGILDKNQNLSYPSGVNVNVVKDQRVYPLHPTAVNRGYIEGMLDSTNNHLLNFTSACGPLVYEGNNYGKDLKYHSFVCGPEVNLIKQNEIYNKEIAITGKQVYEDSEFIASSDEGFRPVNLKVGPDGFMYIIDMHRGLLQHKTYLTSYLRNLYHQKGLDTVVNFGRIFKINHTNSSSLSISNPGNTSVSGLVQMLSSPSGWHRRYAQQLLIEKNDKSSIQLVRDLSESSNSNLTKLHAFWTLEGLDGITSSDILYLWNNDEEYFIPHIIKMLIEHPELINSEIKKKINNYKNNQQASPKNLIYLTALNGLISNKQDDQIQFTTQILDLLKPDHQKFAVFMALSNHRDNEAFMLNGLKEYWSSMKERKEELTGLEERIESNIDYFNRVKNNSSKSTSGIEIFEANCSTCHGRDGKGIEHVAPPLYHSEYIEGRDSAFALIVLHGLKGPVIVDGKEYEFHAVMPGLSENKEYTDREIASVMSYIKNAFGRKPKGISSQFIEEMRKIQPDSNDVYTVKTLEQKLKSIRDSK